MATISHDTVAFVGVIDVIAIDPSDIGGSFSGMKPFNFKQCDTPRPSEVHHCDRTEQKTLIPFNIMSVPKLVFIGNQGKVINHPTGHRLYQHYLEGQLTFF